MLNYERLKLCEKNVQKLLVSIFLDDSDPQVLPLLQKRKEVFAANNLSKKNDLPLYLNNRVNDRPPLCSFVNTTLPTVLCQEDFLLGKFYCECEISSNLLLSLVHTHRQNCATRVYRQSSAITRRQVGNKLLVMRVPVDKNFHSSIVPLQMENLRYVPTDTSCTILSTSVC